MIRWILAAASLLIVSALPGAADVRDVYTVRAIQVDEQAATVIEARERAMSRARTEAAGTLLRRITLMRDRPAAEWPVIDEVLAARLAAAVDVEQETAGAGRYIASLAVVLNPAAVRAYLDAENVPYLDTQAPLALMVPLAGDPAFAARWRAVFPDRSAGSLVPFVLTQDYFHTPDTTWSQLVAEAVPMNARRALIARLLGREGAWRVEVSTVTAAGNEPLGATPPAATMEAALLAVTALLDEAWKEASIVRDASFSSAQAVVRYTSLAEWNTLRSGLASSPLISDFRTLAVAREGALVAFSYAGDEARLTADLVQRGLRLGREDQGMVLRSAVSPVADR